MPSGLRILSILLLALALLAPAPVAFARSPEDEPDPVETTPVKPPAEDERFRGDDPDDLWTDNVEPPKPSEPSGDQTGRDGAPDPLAGNDYDQSVVSEDRRPEKMDEYQAPDLDAPVRSDPRIPQENSQDDLDLGYDGIEQTGQDRGKGSSDLPDADQYSDPLRGRRGPPGRGPQGNDFRWELVDSSNQDGSSGDRERLAKLIFGTGVGFSPEDLRDASRAELVDILLWLDDAAKREADFAKNLERTRQKIERKRKDLYQMSLGELYNERVKGLGDHQKDKDDYRVGMDFKRFLQDRAFGRDAQPGNIYQRLLYDIDYLIIVAGPAYKVEVSSEDVKSVRRMTSLFERDEDKGAFQFPASYIQGLMLDRAALENAIRSKAITRRPGSGKGDDYYQDGFDSRDQWGDGYRPDVDTSGDRGKGDTGYDPRAVRGGGQGSGGISPDQRRLFGDLARAGTSILDANDRYDRDVADAQSQWERDRAKGGPGAPGGGDIAQMEPSIVRAIADSDRMLDDARKLQRTILERITEWRRAGDPQRKAALEANIRGMVYGRDPSRPDPQSLMGMMASQQLQAALRHAQLAQQTENPALRSAHQRIFGPGGKLDRVKRTQADVIARFLQDRDEDRRKGNVPGAPGFDPNDPRNPRDPNDPRNQFDPNDPRNPLDPRAGNNGPGAPGTPDDGRFAGQNGSGNPLPGGGQNQAANPTDRINQIDRALQDPSLTPQERQNLEAERERLRTQQQQQATNPQVQPQGPQAPAATAQAAPLTREQAAEIARSKLPNVPNSYGVAPGVLSDAELQAAARPAIQAELARWNEQLKEKGITVNEYMQYSGPGVTSTGRPAGDHFQHWIQRVPAVKAAMIKAAQDAHNRKLEELTAAELARAPKPAATPEPQPRPVATATPLPSQSGGPTAGAIVEPR